MRNEVKVILRGAVLIATLPVFMLGQAGQGSPTKVIPNDPRPYNPKDLTGIWGRMAAGGGLSAPCQECGDRGFSIKDPEFTPEGKKRFDANKPSYGRPVGEPLKGEPLARVRAVPPAQGNDPQGLCMPQGLPRHLLFPYAFEIMMTTDGRMVQRFEHDNMWRQVWHDGRKLPELPVDLPVFYGYSIGHWEGDVYVVESVGFDDRTWIDHFGFPHSDMMKLTERYHRIAYNKLELIMTVDDPKTFKKPWVSDRKLSILIDPQALAAKSFDHWAGLLEFPCPDVYDGFNEHIRNPVGGIR